MKYFVAVLAMVSFLSGCSEPSSVATVQAPPENQAQVNLPHPNASVTAPAYNGGTVLSFQDFCAQNGGKIVKPQNAEPICAGAISNCDTTQYAQDHCVNFNQCVHRPADCRVGPPPPLTPNFCKGGEIYPKIDACDCRQGTACVMK